MESYQPPTKLGCSKDSIKSTAIKYDVGTINSEKYGEANVSGYLLTLPEEVILPMYEKEVQDKIGVWLNEMGLEKFKDRLFEKNIHFGSLIANTIPDVVPEKLEVYFKLCVFAGLIDDTIRYLSHLNENDPKKQQDDISSLVENLIAIVHNCGDRTATEAAASKVNPVFKHTCLALAYLCRSSVEQLEEDDCKRFIREVVYFIIAQKWMQEHEIAPNNKDEFYGVRNIDIFGSPILCIICIIKGIRIAEDIRRHPVFQRYWENIMRHSTVINDIFSLPKELNDDDKINTILSDCQNYSLQRSIQNVEKEANDLIVALQKDQVRLQLYYPADACLKKFLKLTNSVVNGSLRWYQICARYGNRQIETCTVEYQCDYNTWLEQIESINVESMKEPRLIPDSTNCSVPTIFV